MANMLVNMLKLQTDYRIPMRMDLSTRKLIEYYEYYQSQYESAERELLLKSVISDLQCKLQPTL